MSRAVPNIRSERPAETRDFFVELLGFEVVMGPGLGSGRPSPANPSVQITIVGNDDLAAPGISVGVDDVDAVHARAVEQGLEIAYPLRDEEWGVRRFMLREPSGTVMNVVSHRPRLSETGRARRIALTRPGVSGSETTSASVPRASATAFATAAVAATSRPRRRPSPRAGSSSPRAR